MHGRVLSRIGFGVRLGAAAVYDEQKRPITAGGFVDTGTVVFQDIAQRDQVEIFGRDGVHAGIAQNRRVIVEHEAGPKGIGIDEECEGPEGQNGKRAAPPDFAAGEGAGTGDREWRRGDAGPVGFSAGFHGRSRP